MTVDAWKIVNFHFYPCKSTHRRTFRVYHYRIFLSTMFVIYVYKLKLILSVKINKGTNPLMTSNDIPSPKRSITNKCKFALRSKLGISTLSRVSIIPHSTLLFHTEMVEVMVSIESYILFLHPTFRFTPHLSKQPASEKQK